MAIEDNYLKKYLYTLCLYKRIAGKNKSFCEKVSFKELKQLIEEEFADFMENAKYNVKISDHPDELFHFVNCEAIHNDLDAVFLLREEIMCSLAEKITECLNENEDLYDALSSKRRKFLGKKSHKFKDFFIYEPKKNVGSKLKVYTGCILSNNSALAFVLSSLYFQDILDCEDDVDFDNLYENILNLIEDVFDQLNIKQDSKVTEASFVNDMKKIFKKIIKMNEESSIYGL